MSIEQLFRPHLLAFTPYASARRIQPKGETQAANQLWLNANESPFANVYDVDTDNLNRYPDFQSAELNQAYAAYAQVDAAQLMSHRGSDESIELLIRSLCEPGQDNILICPPTYGMYAISAAINNNQTTEIPLVEGQLNLPAIESALDAVKVIFLCSPSNPLGNNLRRDDILSVVDKAQGQAVVVVDEAYIEYASEPSLINEIEKYDNLVVTRTLSKAFGLAALRVGFTIANATLIDLLKRVLAPYPLPDVSVQIAIQALSRDNIAVVEQQTQEIVRQRQQLEIWLEQQPWVQRIFPSDTNFVLLQVDNADAIMKKAAAGNILIRNQSSQRGLDQCVRITVGNAQENQRLREVLG